MDEKLSTPTAEHPELYVDTGGGEISAAEAAAEMAQARHLRCRKLPRDFTDQRNPQDEVIERGFSARLTHPRGECNDRNDESAEDQQELRADDLRHAQDHLCQKWQL